MYSIMTPGPTNVRENVRLARSEKTDTPNKDLEFYRETCQVLSQMVHTDNQAVIMGGEGILGLEATCASLTEPGDRVLIIDNGIFGKGFGDFVELYQGEPVYFTSDYHRPVDVDQLARFLEDDNCFKYATVVHCDTPSGVLNQVEPICNLLSSHGIITVVDSVAGMFGEDINVDESNIDILCGGSQKALSAPPGLTMVWVSQKAVDAMKNRKTPTTSFYANLLNYLPYYENGRFPYTMPMSDIYGLRVAIENLREDKDVLERHRKIAKATREAVTSGGLDLYLETGFAATVTVVNVPEGYTDKEILEGMREDYNVVIAGCFDVLAGKVIRIGHMGENARVDQVAQVMKAMTGTLKKLGFPVKSDMEQVFLDNIKS